MRSSRTSSSRTRGVAGVALSLTLVAGALGLAAPASASDAPEPDVPPGEVASSNIEHLSNNPKNGALQGTGSDIAFQGKYAFAGNYDGFTVYDLSDPEEPVQALQVYCPGSQNDISVYGDVLVLSTDSSRSDDSCASTTRPATEKDAWEGIKVWDISDPLEPEYVKSVETACGSHTHSLAPSKNGKDLYVYVSSYSPSSTYPDCQPPHDIISVVKIPVKNPAAATLVGTPNLFPEGGYEGDPDRRASATSGCHDITTYAQKDLAAGACMGDGILMDIKDRAHPKVISTVRDTENFAFWHSATFNNDATKVVFTDELGGGGLATCTGEYAPELGANGIYDIEKERKKGGKHETKLVFQSYYKIPRINDATENCVAHNGSLIPVKGKDLMVQSWYQGGVSVFDFTNSKKPRELAWFDRGAGVSSGGTWSTYWYNGYAYSNDLGIGFDTFDIDDRIDGKAKTDLRSLNPQMQQKF
ncbi:LVIVD repeat-containing protein [Isoptericola sp. NPDC056618]|uniref:LVIVD repeat-containing protein n=1 Tax=Isoptericola sp. NPDC056618 TaxID=3345878 RepID=UPI00367DBB18